MSTCRGKFIAAVLMLAVTGLLFPEAAAQDKSAPAGEEADALFDHAAQIVHDARSDPRRERDAIPIFEKAAEAGHLQAMYELYDLYSLVSIDGADEATRRRDDERGHAWLRKAAEGGHVRAAFTVGLNLALKGDVDGAEKWLLPHARRGDNDCMRGLGLMYVGYLNSVPPARRDLAKGLSWLRRAADNGDASARYVLGTLHLTGRNGVPKDEPLAFEYFRRGAVAGATDCMLPLAMCYADGVGVAADPVEAFKWVRIAAEMPLQPYSVAASQLAEMYERGFGTAKDMRQAERWYRVAARLGDEQAKQRLAQPDMWGGQEGER